jgi:hypothetical protein
LVFGETAAPLPRGQAKQVLDVGAGAGAFGFGLLQPNPAGIKTKNKKLLAYLRFPISEGRLGIFFGGHRTRTSHFFCAPAHRSCLLVLVLVKANFHNLKPAQVAMRNAQCVCVRFV